jgi:hypothetical protein
LRIPFRSGCWKFLFRFFCYRKLVPQKILWKHEHDFVQTCTSMWKEKQFSKVWINIYNLTKFRLWNILYLKSGRRYKWKPMWEGHKAACLKYEPSNCTSSQILIILKKKKNRSALSHISYSIKNKKASSTNVIPFMM